MASSRLWSVAENAEWLVPAALSAVALLAAYRFCTSTYGRWRDLGVPYARPVVPLLGNFWRVSVGAEHTADAFDAIYRQLAGHRYGGFYQLRTPFLMIRDPELVNRVLVGDAAHFLDHGFDTDLKHNPMSNNLFFMEGTRWQTMRSKLSPAFTASKLRSAFGQMRLCSGDLVAGIAGRLSAGHDRFNVLDAMAEYSTDVIGTCAFGIKMNAISDRSSAFRMYGKKMLAPTFRSFVRIVCQMISPRLSRALRFQDFSLDSVNFYRSVVRDTFTYRETNDLDRQDIVHYLMRAKEQLVTDPPPDQEDVFTETDIVANAIFLFLAGFESVSMTLSYFLYECALNKEIQDKVREEIIAKKAQHKDMIDNDYLSDLNYMDMVIAETLRRYPPTYTLFRVATKNYQVPDDHLIIEKGQKLIVPVLSIHHDPDYYPNPKVFDPERFSPEQKSKRPSGTYFPFGDGPRICIGKRFAEIEMKIALTDILSKYEVEPCEKTEIPLTFSKTTIIVMSPKNGVWLKFKNL